MTKSSRLLTVLNLIRSNRVMTTSQLARECAVTERTVYRDIQSLGEAGAPVYYDKGYRLLGGAFLPPLNLTAGEYLVLRAAIQGSPLMEIKSYASELKSMTAKIDAAMNGQLSEHIRKQHSRMLLSPRMTADATRGDLTMRLLRQAIDGDIVLEINYHSVSSGEGVRPVDPYFIVFRGHAWYLLGYCHRHDEMRLFRIDRIYKITITKNLFERDHKITLEKYFESSWDVYSGEPVEIKLLLFGKAAAVVSDGKRHASQRVVKRKEGSVEYTVTVAGTEEILRWIIGFGGEARVISPPELVDQVCRLAAEILKNYR
ncbi:MAG: YafY family protein [candidate division Zixibacteria bacterium]|nr:YafY family protein [candidate division Zixibacteria bacterium]